MLCEDRDWAVGGWVVASLHVVVVGGDQDLMSVGDVLQREAVLAERNSWQLCVGERVEVPHGRQMCEAAWMAMMYSYCWPMLEECL